MFWIIINQNDPTLFWSNTDGWVEEGYDTFDDQEKETLTLPIEGQWESVNWHKQ